MANNTSMILSLINANTPLSDLVWIASEVARLEKDIDQKLRLWRADCAAHTLHIYEAAQNSTAPRNAIAAARAFARGEIDDATRYAAWVKAWAAAWAATRHSLEAENAAFDAARAADWEAAGTTAKAASQTWQRNRLVTRLSTPELKDWPLP